MLPQLEQLETRSEDYRLQQKKKLGGGEGQDNAAICPNFPCNIYIYLYKRGKHNEISEGNRTSMAINKKKRQNL